MRNEISTHAPRTGSDLFFQQNCFDFVQFQPTLPARGATFRLRSDTQTYRFQPTLPARGATSRPSGARATSGAFQPTLPARGATPFLLCVQRRLFQFQPTLPARGATLIKRSGFPAEGISTHAPRTGSDQSVHRGRASHPHFNPRSPHGERRRPSEKVIPVRHFNPRSPHGERPLRMYSRASAMGFQPTLPARGATRGRGSADRIRQFQPTLPARGATYYPARIIWHWIFQPTLPARGATFVSCSCNCYRRISTHAPRTGSD